MSERILYLIRELWQILLALEDFWWLQALQYRAVTVRGGQTSYLYEKALVHFGSFRRFLLNLRRNNPESTAGMGLFLPPRSHSPPSAESAPLYLSLGTLPALFADFNLGSRLVIELDDGLTNHLLNEARLPEDLTLADVAFPEQSFAFRLPSAVLQFGQPGPGAVQSGFVLVGTDRPLPFALVGQNWGLIVRAIGTSVHGYQPVSIEERTRLQGLLDVGGWEKLLELGQELDRLITLTGPAFNAMTVTLKSQGPEWNVPLVRLKQSPGMNLLHLVVKLARFLQSLSSSGGSGGGDNGGGCDGPSKEPESEGITDEKDVCSVMDIAYAKLGEVVRRPPGCPEGEGGTRGPTGPRDEHTVRTFKRKPRGSPPGTPKTEVVKEHKRGRKLEGLPPGKLKKIRRRRKGGQSEDADQDTTSGAETPSGS